jgi:hypothetical protein
MAMFPTNMSSHILRSRSEKTRHEREWSAAMRMLAGDQWLYWSRRAKDYTVIGRQPGEVRVTVNQMLNIERNIVARLTMNAPTPVVIPASDHVDDITKATASEMALRYFWLSDKQNRVWSAAIRWMCQTGNAILHTFYEPGVEVKEQLDMLPGDYPSEDGEKEDEVIGSKRTKGRVRCQVVSPFDVFFEPGVHSPDDARWTAIRTYTTKGELKDTYPEKSKEIDELPDDTEYRLLEYQEYKPENRIEVFEVYWRDGRHAIMVGDTYLQKEVSSDVRDVFPVRMMRYHIIEGDLWGQGPMVQIADLQQLYNRTRTQIHANVRLMGNPPWLIPRTADVRKGAMMNKPGAVIRFTPGGGSPTPANPQQMPSHVLREPSVLREEMSDVAGAHGITLGRREPGVKSGVHARTLTQQDATQLLMTQNEIVYSVEDTMKSVLLLMKRHYNESRVVKMLDAAGTPAWRAISNMDIVDNPEIHINADMLFQVDAANREVKVLEMVQLQLMSPEEAREAISFRTYSSQVAQKFLALSHAKEMLEAVIMGNNIQILPTDDLEAFLKVFNEFSQSPDYYDLSPDRQAYIRQIIVDASFANEDDQVHAEQSARNTIHPRDKKPVPVQQDVAMPAPPQDTIGADPFAEVPFPAEGQNVPGVASPPMVVPGAGR